MGETAARTVLVVDDNEVNRALLLRQLERLGYEATAVTSAVHALEAVATTPYALVLMDCRMPGMDGIEAARRIREAEASTGQRLPIVAVTANAMEADREACFSAGMDDFLTKPVMLESLQAVLDRFMGQGEDDTETGPASTAEPDGVHVVPGDEESPDPIVRMYLAELPARVGAIHEAVAAADARGLTSAAHTLKSTSGLVGATKLEEICADLEAGGRSGKAAELADRLPLLDEETATARLRLDPPAAEAAG